MTFPVVFMDFAGPDDTALRDFYTSVFQWDIDQQGKFAVSVSSSIDCAMHRVSRFLVLLFWAFLKIQRVTPWDLSRWMETSPAFPNYWPLSATIRHSTVIKRTDGY